MNRKMTTTLRNLVAALGLSVFSIPLSQAAEPTSYPMMCKGGGITRAQIDAVASPPGLKATLIITKSSRPATSGLRGGECAWMDRGISANEPSSLIINLTGVFARSIIRMDQRDNLAISFTGDARKAGQMNRLIQSVRSGQEYQVYAYNDNRGHFIVTRVGP